MFKSKGLFLYLRALLCVAGCISFIFNFANVSAQTKRLNSAQKNVGGGAIVAATLTDSFPDPNNDGRADAGAEVTYTATIVNNGTSDATNVSFTNTIDANATLVAGSVQVQSDLSSYVIRCVFDTTGGGSGNCSLPSTAYGQTDTDNYTILGGQGSRLNLTASNVAYNSGAGMFSFDATIQNLIAQSIGTIDDVIPEATGVRLFLNNTTVNAGNGVVSIANADGTGNFTAPNQPYYQFSEIIPQNQTSSAKTLQLNVPNTVNSFTVDFLVSTKAAAKLVINEVLSNPGGTISDANGEWFEVYNNGLFPVNMRSFIINEFAAGDTGNGCELGPNGTTTFCARPPHTIASDVIIQPGGYGTFGNTTNTTNNGGVPIDYAYGASLALANSLDGVRIQSPNSLPPTNTIVLDKTFYASPGISAQNGISRELKNHDLDNINMDGANWADALVTSVYGPGGRGTPKAQNGTFTPFAETIAKAPSFDKVGGADKSNFGGAVSVNVGTITPGGAATVTYRVTISDPMPSGVTQISNQGLVTGDDFANAVTDDPSTPASDDSTITLVGLAPTAALVTIGGQVTDGLGRAVYGAQVELFDAGEIRRARTNSFGYYRFDGITAGSIAVVSVRHKRYVFAPQVVAVNDNIADLNFTAQNNSPF